MIQVFESIGTRDYSAQLDLNGTVIFMEGGREHTRLTLNDALAALAEVRHDDDDIRQATIDDMLRALIHDCARST